MEHPADKAREAITALGTPSHDAANSWLTEFESTPEAWEAAQTLLQDPPGSTTRFYGANMFYNKIRRDFIQLRSSATELRVYLVELVGSLSQEHSIDRTLLRRVLLALAALALQLNEPNVVNDILDKLSPVLSHAPQILLDLLTVLPEECYNDHIDIDYDQRDEFSEQLSASAPKVLEFLCTFTAEGSGNNEIHVQLLKCFSRWIEHTAIGQDVLAEHPLIQYTLNSLRDRDLFEEAVDVVIGLFRQFGGQSCMEYHMALPSVLMPNVLELTQLWNQEDILKNMHDENVCRGVSRVMTEMLESYLLIITMQQDFGQTQLLDQLILCAQYPWDFDISRIPLKGFYELSAMIKNSSSTGGQDRFGSYYATLLEIVIPQSRMNEDSLMGAEEEDNYERSELNESIVDVIDVIGAEQSLQIVLGMLEQCQGVSDVAARYTSIEACLNGVDVISHFLGPDDHSSSQQLMEYITTLPSDIPGIVRVRNKIVSGFSRYLAEYSQHLPLLLELVSTGLLNEYTVATSANTLMVLFKFCPAVLQSLDISTFYDQICQLRASGGLPVKSDVDILAGLSHVISDMDVDNCENALKYMIDPIMSGITGDLAHASNQKIITEHIDRITILMSSTRCRRSLISSAVQHPVLTIFLNILPTFQEVLSVHSTEAMCEKICRCYKHVMRNTQESFIPYMEAMADHLILEFQTKPFASFVYISSICVSVFSDSLQSAHTAETGDLMIGRINVAHLKMVLQKLYQEISALFFTRCDSLANFEEYPDLVEEYFYYSARIIQSLPEQFLTFEASHTILQSAITGLSMRHREAQKGILLFFERFVDLPKQMHDMSLLPDAEPAASQLANISQELLMSCMPSLVEAIFAGLSGAIPSYAIDENYGSIADVLWRLKSVFPEEFTVCMNDAFETLHNVAQEHAMAMNLCETLMQAPHMRRFSQVLELFQRKCKRVGGTDPS